VIEAETKSRLVSIPCYNTKMSPCNSRQATEERAIFEAFLRAYPSFACEIIGFKQPEQSFPDIIAKLKTDRKFILNSRNGSIINRWDGPKESDSNPVRNGGISL
jgi:hypothetical protein